MRTYTLYCGDTSCRSRREAQPDGSIGRLFYFTDADLEAFDGQVWLCPACVAAQTKAAS